MKTVWYITVAVVVLTVAMVAWRQYSVGRQHPTPEPAAKETAKDLTGHMLALLATDARAQRKGTWAAVKAVAALGDAQGNAPAEAYYARGLMSYQRTRYDEAEEAYRKAAALKPDWAWPHNALALLLYERGREEEALASFDRALQLDPKWSRPHNDLSILLRFDNRLEEAEEELQAALKLDPDSVVTQNTLGNLRMAQCLYEDAEAAYQRAITSEPTCPAPYYNLGCLYCIQGRKEDGLALLAKAIAIDEVFRDEARRDPDLDSMRGDPAFHRLVYVTRREDSITGR